MPVPFFTGSDLKLIFPITIGTVPLGKSLTSSIGRQDDIPGMFTHTHTHTHTTTTTTTTTTILKR